MYMFDDDVYTQTFQLHVFPFNGPSTANQEFQDTEIQILVTKLGMDVKVLLHLGYGWKGNQEHHILCCWFLITSLHGEKYLCVGYCLLLVVPWGMQLKKQQEAFEPIPWYSHSTPKMVIKHAGL